MTKTTKFAIAAGILISAMAFAAQDGFTLNRDLKTGTTETYSMEATLATNLATPMGEQPVSGKTEATVEVKTTAVDSAAGSADVDTVTTFTKVEMSSDVGGAGPTIPEPVKASGKLDSKGRLKLVSAVPEDLMLTVLSGSNMSSLSTVFLELPDKAVKVGDSWDVTIPANAIMKEAQKLSAKLVGEKDVDGTKALEVSLTGTLTTEITDGTMPESVPMVGGQAFTLKGTVTVTGTGFINPTSGQTLKLDTEFKGKQTLMITAMGLEIGADSTLTTKSALKK